MKTVLIVILLVVITISGGYFGLPIFIEKKTAGLQSDIQDIKKRLQKIEEESKMAPLKPGANVQEVIKTVNTIYHKMNSLESSFNKDISATNEALKNQKMITEESFKRQKDVIEKLSRETEAELQRIMFNARMANIISHILKARVEIVAKNVGTAKNELDLINEAFERTKASASEENNKVIEELQTTLKKAKSDIESDLPAALNRIDLLWHEMGKLLRRA
ncbi:MAG: hypothetical protein HXY47_03225 [Nitrospirae bacterium]|nr:hypothetical protein [Nitrospirota bacterium]